MAPRHPGTRKPRRRGRRPASRPSLPRISILCEGARTERSYFLALVRDLDLPSVKVRSPQRGQQGPAGIMTAAQQERERDSDLDEIWCVLDHDERAEEIRKFREWLERHSSAKKGSATISAAISVPCFEYWLLLHFTYTDKPFHGTPGGPSACKQVIRELGTHLHGYQKADPGTYDRCREHTSIAIWNAKRSQRPMGASSTNVWELIEKLQELGTTKRKRDEG
ncbi:MAG: RloB family protein [Gammaproteobacteria bacterium]|nr:RloB family protein [Gammaproteobacteria bacterium]